MDENEKKRPKLKNMNQEDIKPIYSVGLADLTEFYNVSGKAEVILRKPLIMKETYEKRKENNIHQIQPIFEPKENDLKLFLFVHQKYRGTQPKTEKGKQINTENS